MGFYEDKRDGVAARALAKYGMAAQLVVPAAGVFDPETGALTQGTDKTYAVQVLLGSVTKARKQELTHASTLQVYLSASGLAVVPAVNNKLRISGVDYEILRSTPIAPGGVTVLYDLSVAVP